MSIEKYWFIITTLSSNFSDMCKRFDNIVSGVCFRLKIILSSTENSETLKTEKRSIIHLSVSNI